MNLAGRIQAIKYMKRKNYEQKIEANACTSSPDLYDWISNCHQDGNIDM